MFQTAALLAAAPCNLHRLTWPLVGMFDIGMAVGFDKHPRGAFTIDPEASGLGNGMAIWHGAHAAVFWHENSALHA